MSVFSFVRAGQYAEAFRRYQTRRAALLNPDDTDHLPRYPRFGTEPLKGAPAGSVRTLTGPSSRNGDSP